ncbi:MAG: hypothetical protein ACPGYL_02625, partial [Rhodospirillaceae bacterium]
MTDTPYRDRLSEKITAGLAPVQLEIKDDSHKHSGHADRIAALAAERGPDDWIVCYRHNEQKSGGYPTIEEMDRAAAGRP